MKKLLYVYVETGRLRVQPEGTFVGHARMHRNVAREVGKALVALVGPRRLLRLEGQTILTIFLHDGGGMTTDVSGSFTDTIADRICRAAAEAVMRGMGGEKLVLEFQQLLEATPHTVQ
jgi:hypothetical protein